MTSTDSTSTSTGPDLARSTGGTRSTVVTPSTDVTASRDVTASTDVRSGTDAPGPRADELGVGARFSVHPAADDFVGVILGALHDVRDLVGDDGLPLTEGLVVETDDVSTYVGAAADPAEQRLARYLVEVIAAAARRTPSGHLVAHVLLSRGCPGETSCDLAVTGLPRPAPVHLTPSGVRAVAQWSLYPLADPGSPAVPGSSSEPHMHHIEAAIARARARGTAAAPAHYATRLTGDLVDVLATAVDAWAGVGREVAHVVSHLTISIGSPSAPPQAAEVVWRER